jgi:alpha-beta hydrolase superfamily lysophospholipase
MTTAIAKLTAEELIAAAYEAVDVAAGLGERVAVLGISMGGLQCSYLTQYRSDVALSVPIAPDFGLLHFARPVTTILSALAQMMPNLFVWWDPRIKAAQRPKTAYPRFATHALMQTLRIGNDVYAQARSRAICAKRTVMVLNARDPAVNNRASQATLARWKALRPDAISSATYADLPSNHDIIDPDNSLARTDVVYPRLLDILTSLP